MNASVRQATAMLVLCAGLTATGCQTYELGQVLPSGRHMRDDIQYFPKGPDFPLANELNAMQSAEAEREAAIR